MYKSLAALTVIIVTHSSANTFSVDQISNISHANNKNVYQNVNTASPATLISDKFGLSLSIGASISGEIGKEDFSNDINDLGDELNRDDITLAEAEDLIERFNHVLSSADKDGYFKGSITVLPPLSLYYKTKKYGTFTLSSFTQLAGSLSVLSKPLSYNPITEELETDSGLYVKSAEHTQISLGHSIKYITTNSGNLFLGSRINLNQFGLSKQIIPLNVIDSDDDISDVVSDTYKENKKTTNTITVDVGAIWKSEYYSVGLNINNINAPSAHYRQLGKNCESKNSNTINNCYASQAFDSEIKLKEVFKLKTLLTGTVAIHNKINSFGIEVAGQTKAYTPLGDENQWLSMSIYSSQKSTWIPGVRATLAKNLTGTKLSYGVLGFSLNNIAEIQIGASLDETTFDGNKVPRSAFAKIKLGFEF
jgi:hypothetical protein